MGQVDFTSAAKVVSLSKTAGETINIVQNPATDDDILTKLVNAFEKITKGIETYKNMMPQAQPQQSQSVSNISPHLLQQSQPQVEMKKPDDKMAKIVAALLQYLEPYLDRCPDDMTIGQAIANLDILKVSEVKMLLKMYKQSLNK